VGGAATSSGSISIHDRCFPMSILRLTLLLVRGLKFDRDDLKSLRLLNVRLEETLLEERNPSCWNSDLLDLSDVFFLFVFLQEDSVTSFSQVLVAAGFFFELLSKVGLKMEDPQI